MLCFFLFSKKEEEKSPTFRKKKKPTSIYLSICPAPFILCRMGRFHNDNDDEEEIKIRVARAMTDSIFIRPLN
jgi:hypothetical protein